MSGKHLWKIAIVATALLLTGSLDAQTIRLRVKVSAGGVGGSPLSRNEHPRMWVTEDNIASIRTRVATGGGLNGTAQAWIDWLDSNYTTAWGASEMNYFVLHPAFAYLLLRDGPISGLTFSHTATEYGNKAADLLLAYIASNGGAMADDRSSNAIITYDWAWPFFSAGERDTIESWVKTVHAETNEPFNVVSVGFMISRVLCGLAIYGDGLDDAWALDRINEYENLFIGTGGTLTMQTFYGGNHGENGEGLSYAYAYHNEWQILIEEAWRTANAATLATHYGHADRQYLLKQGVNMMYHILPFAVSSAWRLEKGQYEDGVKSPAEEGFRNWIQVARSLYAHDSNAVQLAQWLLDNKIGGQSFGDNAMLRFVMPGILVFGPESSATATSPTALGMPSTVLMDSGHFIFRDDWTTANASYVTFDATKWFTTTYHSRAFGPGTWQIHRRGPQAVNHGGVTGHDWGGGRNAGSTNSLIFVDSTLTPSAVDATTLTSSSTPVNTYEDLQAPVHRNVAYPDDTSDFAQNGFWDARDDFAYVLADRPGGQDFDYVFVDHTRTYPSTRFTSTETPTRVSEVIRQFVYKRPATHGSSNPDFVFVFDRATTTDTKYERRNIIHTVGEPTVDGSSSAGPSRNGTTAGRTQYTGATVISASNTTNSSDGKTFITPILPESFTVVKAGGPNAGTSWVNGSYEYQSPYGLLWNFTMGGGGTGVVTSEIQQYVGGQYRIEIIPTTSNLIDTHLYVVEVANAGASQTAVTKISPAGSTFTGAQVEDFVAVFHKTSSAATSGTFTLPTAGTYRVFIGSLSPGTSRTVTGGANISSITSIKPVDSGSPFTTNTPTVDAVTGSVAGWLYLTITVSSSGSTAANVITVG